MFKHIKTKVQHQFKKLAKDDLYVVDLAKNELFDAYLNTFTDPVLRQEHNCNCCKTFLNKYGGIVSIKNGKISTLWEFNTVEPYSAVPSTLDQLIKSKPLKERFITKLEKLGTDYNHQRVSTGEIIKWDHFFMVCPPAHRVAAWQSIATIHGDETATRHVFERSLETITEEAVQIVLELINNNTLYRGAEFQKQLKEFLKFKRDYIKSPNKQLFVFANAKAGGRIRNTAIGTLLVDLSNGVDVESAVRSYEHIMAPANYKRPTALVTRTMINQAQDTIANLGLESALRRRHATLDDIPVTNVLFINRDNKNKSVFDEMLSEVPVNLKSFSKAKELTLAKFISDVLPTATTLEVLLENTHNFMSLIAPEDSDSPNLFNWDNKISWTYQNNLTDAIKEKVKNAGGNVDGELRISLEWFNFDDLDLHVTEPNSTHIYYGDKKSRSSCGFLDVDMNAGGGTTREPVENVIYTDKKKTQEGRYVVEVNNFRKRENTDFGFNIQIECQDTVYDLSYSNAVQDGSTIEVATFHYSKEHGITNFNTNLTDRFGQKLVNGVLTNRFQKVNMLLFSPNHWTNEIGNKHLFFIIDKVNVEDSLRPFFNEYIKSDLQSHRKVFEILGNKMQIGPSPNQLSGIGFSLTQSYQLIVKVNNTVYKVNI